MRRRFRPAWACVLASGLGVLVASAAEPADGVLKDKGLSRSGSTFVLPDEAVVQKKLKEANQLYQQLSYSLAQQRMNAQGALDRKAMIRDLTQQRILLSERLAQASSAEENNRMVGMINAVTDRLNLLQQDAGAERDDVNGAKSDVPRLREAFIESVLDLRRLVDGATEHYARLGDDAEVTGALDTLNQKSKAKSTLGPSRAFQSNVKLLEKVEASVLTENVELRKNGGVFWLDVTFNGKVTRPMVFDTGASLTTLPAELASEIGLKPSANDPTIRCQVADGSVVEAKQMTIASMRVGKFTVTDIECAVMPGGKADVPPLLGGSFHRLFMYKFSPESGKLVLSRVDLPDDDRTSAKAKSSRSTKTRKSK